MHRGQLLEKACLSSAGEGSRGAAGGDAIPPPASPVEAEAAAAASIASFSAPFVKPRPSIASLPSSHLVPDCAAPAGGPSSASMVSRSIPNLNPAGAGHRFRVGGNMASAVTSEPPSSPQSPPPLSPASAVESTSIPIASVLRTGGGWRPVQRRLAHCHVSEFPWHSRTSRLPN
jgi:hypothetical protein